LQAPDEVASRGFQAADMAEIASMRAKAFVGTEEEVADSLRTLAARLELDELVVNTWAHAPAVRRRSYALLAKAFGLVPSDGAGRVQATGGP
ncbi:MAG TPA: LLM class flavin-dependent oxidoreductase, partial [Caldimonas sp.]|nr:LLM class flavin-dependent oxidoreductase [Caldimonas sp.]